LGLSNKHQRPRAHYSIHRTIEKCFIMFTRLMASQIRSLESLQIMVPTPQGRTTICNLWVCAFSSMPFFVWKPWAFLKYTFFFALVVLQNHVWEANRLQKKKVAKLRAIKDLQPSAKIVQPFSLQMSLLR
jgi:hypothetical protein